MFYTVYALQYKIISIGSNTSVLIRKNTKIKKRVQSIFEKRTFINVHF